MHTYMHVHMWKYKKFKNSPCKFGTNVYIIFKNCCVASVFLRSEPVIRATGSSYSFQRLHSGLLRILLLSAANTDTPCDTAVIRETMCLKYGSSHGTWDDWKSVVSKSLGTESSRASPKRPHGVDASSIRKLVKDLSKNKVMYFMIHYQM
jgi:hypothetical protein